jgi:hypothetical protein
MCSKEQGLKISEADLEPHGSMLLTLVVAELAFSMYSYLVAGRGTGARTWVFEKRE